MTFKIATGATEAPRTKSGMVDEGLNVDLSNGTRAERLHRQIIDNIEACETSLHLMGYWMDEGTVLTAMQRSWPEFHALAHDRYETQLAVLIGCERPSSAPAEPRPAEPGNDTSERTTPMFSIDTNTGGESGPFLNYKQRAGQGMPDGSWYLREKDGDDWHYSDMTETMRKGVLADIFATHEGELGGTLKLGFIKFNEGAPADRRWWASPLAQEQRPDETKTAGGGFAWQNTVSFRVALGGNKSALFDVSGWGGYKGVMSLINQMNSGFSANTGKCPVFQYTGFRTEGSGSKRLHVPEFVVLKWADRPACLKPDAPQVGAAQPTPAPQPASQPAPQAQTTPADTSAVSEDVAF